MPYNAVLRVPFVDIRHYSTEIIYPTFDTYLLWCKCVALNKKRYMAFFYMALNKINTSLDHMSFVQCMYSSPYAFFRHHNKFKFNVRVAINSPTAGLKHAIYFIRIQSHWVAPRVDEITMCIIEQPNSFVDVRYAPVKGLGYRNGVNVQTHIWKCCVSHRLGMDRL